MAELRIVRPYPLQARNVPDSYLPTLRAHMEAMHADLEATRARHQAALDAAFPPGPPRPCGCPDKP